ncbi:MAG: hypothetical protein MPJ50_05545 [Pirellulales bacterium]|nr:hypothetical protein [Pirellulales bacterium]
MIRMTLSSAVMALALGLLSQSAAAQDIGYQPPLATGSNYSNIPPVSYNYYYPAYGGELPARMYFSPLPIPGYVGYTYVTYPGLAPHQFLWPHLDTYTRVHPNGGSTNTSIRYSR